MEKSGSYSTFLVFAVFAACAAFADVESAYICLVFDDARDAVKAMRVPEANAISLSAALDSP